MEENVAMNAHLPNLHLFPGGHAQNLGIVNWNYPAFTLVERRWLPKIIVDWEVLLPSVLQVYTHPCRVSFFPSCCLGLFSFYPSFRDWIVCFFMFSLPMWFLFLFCSVCPLFCFVYFTFFSAFEFVFFSFVLCFFSGLLSVLLPVFPCLLCCCCFDLLISFVCFYIFSLAFKLSFLFSCLVFFLFCSRVFTFFFSLVFACSLACCSLFVVLFLLFMFFLFFNCLFCSFPMVVHFLFSCRLSCPLPVLNLVWHCLSFFLSSVVFLFYCV